MVAHIQPASIAPIPAFADNYIWLIRLGQACAVVDPGDARPVIDLLARDGLDLRAIVLTHHHADHTGGVAELKALTGATVYAPRNPSIEPVDVRLAEGDRLKRADLDLDLAVLEVPGHTLDHIAYFGRAAGSAPVLFCGDTLFACGCGRLFEGTAAQMHASLSKLAALPGETRVYCTHEYTQSNVRFARAVEPENDALLAWDERVNALRAGGEPTLPTTMMHERAVNPFLRAAVPAVRASAGRQLGHAPGSDVEAFAAIRNWKNTFR